MKSKILFICRERKNSGNNHCYGTGYCRSIGLINSAQFIVNYLNDIDIESKLSVVVDANSIDRELFLYKPTHVVLEAIWITPLKIKELLKIKRYENLTWIIRLHSKIPFIANEGIAFEWIVGYSKLMKTMPNLYLAVNSPEFIDDLKKILNVRGLYLPNVYYPKDEIIAILPQIRMYVNFGCFGAIRPMKNQLIQAVAAIEYGEETNQEIHFHINADRQELQGDNVYKNLKALFLGTRHTLIEHPWLSRVEFLAVIATMDIGLQVSMSETFNIVAADFISKNIPLIG